MKRTIYQDKQNEGPLYYRNSWTCEDNWFSDEKPLPIGTVRVIDGILVKLIYIHKCEISRFRRLFGIRQLQWSPVRKCEIKNLER